MCLIVLGWQADHEDTLVVAANRDEFHARPTAPLGFWPGHLDVLAGRDLQSGGTWMGVTRGGRFAALTNFRDPSSSQPGARSRGLLVSAFLFGSADARRHAERVSAQSRFHNGFNLSLCDGERLVWVGHRNGHDAQVSELAPGTHAISNHLPGTPWPKLLRAQRGFTAGLDTLPATDALFSVLADSTPAADADLPDTGVGLDWERRLSPVFIRGDDYGTRSSALLRVSSRRILFEERRFGPGGRAAGRTIASFAR